MLLIQSSYVQHVFIEIFVKFMAWVLATQFLVAVSPS
jgi:hypothetical protein